VKGPAGRAPNGRNTYGRSATRARSARALPRAGTLPCCYSHLTIVFAALAVSRWIEERTGWSIRKFVRTARRYRTIEIQVGAHTITAADPLPGDLRDALDRIAAIQVRTNVSQVGS
jgi:hypothetical protein